MAYSNVSDTQLLDPTTGQYYTEQVYTPQNSYNPFGGNSASIAYGIMNSGMGGYNQNNYVPPQTRRQYTGDVSQVFKMMQNKQPYQYNVPSIASMFPSMTMPTMGNFQGNQSIGGLLNQNLMGSSGAARFLGANQIGSSATNMPPVNNVMPPQNQPMRPLANMPPPNPYINQSNMTKGSFGYYSPYTNAGGATWDKIIASAPDVSTRPAPQSNGFRALVNK